MIIEYEIGFFGQMWPIGGVILIMQRTISWNSDNSILNTLAISGLFIFLFIDLKNTVLYTLLCDPVKVKISELLANQQETKDICLVGSSETLRSLSSNAKSELH
jgi:hypothetical protein